MGQITFDFGEKLSNFFSRTIAHDDTEDDIYKKFFFSGGICLRFETRGTVIW